MAQSAIPVRGTSQLHVGWVGVGALLVAVALIAGLAGYYISDSRATPTDPDQALADSVGAAVSYPYDAAEVAALYATDATLYDLAANETSTGLAEIQAKAARLAALDFVSKDATAPTRQGDTLARFETHGQEGQVIYPGLVVVQLDPATGKIKRQWVYAEDEWPYATP